MSPQPISLTKLHFRENKTSHVTTIHFIFCIVNFINNREMNFSVEQQFFAKATSEFKRNQDHYIFFLNTGWFIKWQRQN